MSRNNSKTTDYGIESHALSGKQRRAEAQVAANRTPAHCSAILLNAQALPDMLTAENLEALWQIDRKTIYAWAKQDLIPHSRMGSAVRFSKHRILAWLEERSYEPHPRAKSAKRQ